MSRKLPYAKTHPQWELTKLKTIIEKKQFAYNTGHSRRKAARFMTDAEREAIPAYKRQIEHYPLYVVRRENIPTIEQRLKQAGVADDIRPRDTYRARVRNYRFKRGEFSYRK